MLDIFKSDVFSVMSLTDTINSVPFVPGRVGQVIQWNEKGVATTTVMIEEQNGELRLINPTPRGGIPETVPKNRRKARNLSIPHYEIMDGIYADEVQGIRAFGTENQVQTVKGLVDQRMTEHVQLRLDPTLEYQRLGAVKGVILNADGTTLYNLFDEFGVTQHPVVNFDLANGAPVMGAIRQKAADVARLVAASLGGIPYSGIYALAGDAFFDALVGSAEVRQTYLNQQEASQLRTGIPIYGQFNFGGITWENYRGAVGDEPFIDTDEAHIFPVGVPGLFRTLYGPADYIETVNTIGLPRYTKQFPMPNDKGITMEVQMNAISYCTRPRVLIKAVRAT